VTRAEATLRDADLEALERQVERALEAGEEGELPVLGYGEISLVLRWPAVNPEFACKRLPLLPSMVRFEAYRQTLEDYLAALEDVGIHVARTEMRAVPRPDGTVAGYVVQPILPESALAPEVLRRGDPAAGHPLVEAVVTTAARAVGPRLGLDAQLANWTWQQDSLTYIDVSTPMVWAADGRPRLDMALLAAAFPGILRWPLRRFVAPGILDTYRDLRKVYLDLTGNLIKQGLDGWLPAFLERVNHFVERPLTDAEVRSYYRSDARLWSALLRLRKLDRAWRRRVRHRPYPFLLPGRIER
jgi:hypothetical protein